MNSMSLPITPAASASDLTSAGLSNLALAGKNAEGLAQEFESLFLSTILKQMRQSSLSEDGLFPGDSSDTYGGMFDMFLGRHIAQNGGIGLAEALQPLIEKSTGVSEAAGAAVRTNQASAGVAPQRTKYLEWRVPRFPTVDAAPVNRS